jgi:hypothetical protein
MMNAVMRLVLAVAVAVVVFSPNLSSDIPHQITYQGRLTGDSGNPLTGTHSLTFAVYADSTGGTALWSETHGTVPVNNGLFAVVLGSISPMGSTVFASQPRWVGLIVDGEPELPRTRIVAVPYAFYALRADTAAYALQAAGSGGGGWTDDGTTVRLATGTDLVGIGTADPQEKLHVDGDIRLGNYSSIAFGSDSSRLYSSSTDMILTADDDLHLQPDDDVYLRRDGGSAWVHFDNSAQKLGIGITEPPYKLTVQGEISIASAGVSKYHINYYQGGLNFAETGVSDRRIHIGDGGNVGIGTAAPGARLGVNGDLKVNGAFKGNISSASGTDGAPFPRPAFNSGWVDITPGESKFILHNIRGDTNNYVIDLTFRDEYQNQHAFGLGGYYQTDPWQSRGCYWNNLSDTALTIQLGPHEGTIEQVRVRIWVIE